MSGEAGPAGGFADAELLDSRRLTGPNRFWNLPGAVLDIRAPEAELEALLPAWQDAGRRLLDALGWSEERMTFRRWTNGASLVISAPPDVLYAATEVNEAAWAAALRTRSGAPDPGDDLPRLEALIREEAKPAWIAMAAAARAHGVAFLADDDQVSVGMGSGSRLWPASAVPEPAAVDWSRVRDIPTVLITGTNGKTTTVRLLAAMAAAHGIRHGSCTTDGIQIGDHLEEAGDWSGPGGARRILRHPEVDLAILETARGGILRRGLALPRADLALITNLAEDHLGEWGIQDLDQLGDAKFTVARIADRVVLNADDPTILRQAADLDRPVTWFSLDPRHPRLIGPAGPGVRRWTVEDGELRGYEGADRILAVPLTEVPSTLGGAAWHNVANALGALAAARELEFPLAAMVRGLREFLSSPDRNPGRFNLFTLGGARMIVDYAHNPHGLSAVMETAAALEPRRTLVVLGQAGDRDEDSIRELARTAWAHRPDRIVLKELPGFLRGRAAGEVTALLREELATLGVPAASLEGAASELDAVHRALAWSREGDLLLLLCHESRGAVIELLERLRETGWTPGTPLPTP